jgi:hypothetical protein
VLDVPDEALQQMEAESKLELEALWQPLPRDVSKLAMESKIASYTTIQAQSVQANGIHAKIKLVDVRPSTHRPLTPSAHFCPKAFFPAKNSN